MTEPVAWTRDKLNTTTWGEGDWQITVTKDKCEYKQIPLYTAPPKREWVGLTREERDEIQARVHGAVPHHVAFAHAIEQALKEKNNG